jgi:UDP-N-acetylmuramate dehydrogenase
MSIKEIERSAVFRKLKIFEQVPLAQFSTLKVGGPARYLVLPTSPSEIAFVSTFAKEHNIDLHIVSGGSNTLFSDEGYFGIVMKLAANFDFIHCSDDGLSLSVGASTSFAKLTKTALSRGWAHALGWCGTPGLVGGAIRMNAGTRMGEIKDALSTIHCIVDGKETVVEKSDLEFGYRSNSLPKDAIIFQASLSYQHSLLEPIEQLEKKVQDYRQKRRMTQPSTNSLGSFFLNPYPMFAAQLIEKCNLKGLQCKGAQISPLHANFIVNNGGATANDILYIASIAQRTVFDQFGVMLRPEIRMVGRFDISLSMPTYWQTNVAETARIMQK